MTMLIPLVLFLLVPPGYYPAPRVGIVEVTSFGARGDGSTNDTAAVQAAIDHVYAAGGGIVHIPPTTTSWRLAGVSVSAGVQVIVSPGASIKPASNANMVLMKPGGIWQGGVINTFGTFTAAVFTFDGADKYVSSLKRTTVRDIFLIGGSGVGAGTAFDFVSILGDGTGNITGVLVDSCQVLGYEYAIRMRRSGGANDNWINANTFRDLWIGSTVNMVSQEEDTAGVQLDGNRFVGLSLQWSAVTATGFTIKGRGNHIEATFWDWGAVPALTCVSGSAANYAILGMPLAPTNVVDSGTINKITRLWPSE